MSPESSPSPRPRPETDPRARRRRRLLWIGFLVVLAPLVVLLVLQYRWLVDLEHSSKIARTAAIENYLRSVTRQSAALYTSAAERSLNVPAPLLAAEYHAKLGKILSKRDFAGARQVFVVSYVDWPRWQVFLHDRETATLRQVERGTPDVAAIYMAAAPWAVMRKNGGVIDSTAPIVEERDPAHRMILYPITEDSTLVGLAGMFLDPEYLVEQLVPEILADSWQPFPREDLAVAVRDAAGRTVLGPELDTAAGGAIESPFGFVFADWTIAARAGTATPAQWARANFALNMSLSTALGVALIGGILLVLRTAGREMRLSQMKNDFVSNVSHELRTPLASIRVFGELLRLGRVREPEKVREYGESIETESRRLTQLIHNILDFSHIESGCKVYSPEPLEVESVARGVLETFQVRLRSGGFDIELELPAEPLPRVRIDRGALRQALCNLLDNAVKYSGDSRRIRLRLERRRERVVITVIDQGIGIARAEQDKIFERFHRVSTGLVHDVKGSGLGLSIVRHIVEAHGGEVRLESELGGGSQFSIELPAAAAADTEPEPLEPRNEGGLELQHSG